MMHTEFDKSAWMVLGALMSAAYLMATIEVRIAFIACMILALCVASILFIRSDNNVVGISIAFAMALMLTGNKLLVWDSVSFELQAFFDWHNGMKGAYWEYSKIPSMIFGFAYTNGRDCYRLIYATQIVMAAAAICRLFPFRLTVLQCAAFAYIASSIFPKIFDNGKGDLLTLGFSVVALIYAPIGSTPKERAHSSWPIFIIYASLAIGSKLSALLTFIPLGAAAVFSSYRTPRIQKRGPEILLLSLLVAINISGFIYNLINYGALLELGHADPDKSLSIIQNLGLVLSKTFQPIPNINASLIFITILIGIELITTNSASPSQKVKSVALLYALLLTPAVCLFGLENSNNMRLIAFPIIAIYSIHLRRHNEVPPK